jgi:hypothetical protein
MRNPYRNHSASLIKKRATIFQVYINKHIKDTKVNITIGEMIECAQCLAFDEGKKAGKTELQNDLKELLDINDRNDDD